MAYAALISLENTINRTLNHDRFSVTLEEKQQIISLLEHVNSFQGSLEEFPDKFNSLEGRMRELVDEAEDILEYIMLRKVSSSSDDQHKLPLRRVMGKIGMLARKVEKVKEDDQAGADPAFSWSRFWAEQLKPKITNASFYFFCKIKTLVQGGVDDSASSSSSTSAPSNPKDANMVGFEDYVQHVKEQLYAEQRELQVIPICGMGGIGKTTLAKNIYDDPLTMEMFYIRVWVTISEDYSALRIFSSFLDSLKAFDTGGLEGTEEVKVYKILKGRKYLVVMDDIWSSETWDVVRNVLPDDRNGSRILLTTRHYDVASYPDSLGKPCEITLMDSDQSWMLFKHKVFKEEDCPGELEKTGKLIAGSCKGLPLAIVIIAGVVSTIRRNLAPWQEIAENIKSIKQNQIQEILALSYFELPQSLRPCFLYMGSFPEDEDINVTRLIRLWVAEGFLRSQDNFEKVAEECLEELVRRNLVLVKKRKWDGRIKSCGLHDMMRDLCIRKAGESQFFLNLKDRDIQKESFIESIKYQRRLNIDFSILRHLSRSGGSTIHSIKCSKYYTVLLDFLEGVRLLRVLDAEATHLEGSPSMERRAELFHLRYFAVGHSNNFSLGQLNLQNLQTLIIRTTSEKSKDLWLRRCIPHLRHVYFHGTTTSEKSDDLWLPWGMPHLRHVYFHGTIYFSDPKEETDSLGSLETISYVSHESCTERILKKISNLKKLKVDCASGNHPGKAACLRDLVHLHCLKSLELCARRRVRLRPKFYSFRFPKLTLKKLILRDLELPLKDFIVVGWLPNLQVLKIRRCTCLGGFWKTTEGEFPGLEFLLIEEFDFSNWITESGHFPKLKRLLLSNCWCLDKIPIDIGEILSLELIEVKGGKESLVKSAVEIHNEQEDNGNNTLQVVCNGKPIR